MALTIKSKDGGTTMQAAPKPLPVPIVQPPNEFEQHLESAPAHGTVHIAKFKGPKDNQIEQTLKDENHLVHPGIMAASSEICRIGVEASRTVNLGKFESAKIGVTIQLPCLKADLNETYEFGLKWVSEKIEEAVGDAKN